MYFWSGIAATDCGYATQDKTITEQLAMGIRYLDFDISYIHKSQESLPYWEEGPVLVDIGTSVAYSTSLRKALTEIREFLTANRDEVIGMRIKQYYPRTREMRDNLLSVIKPLYDSVFGPEGSEGVQLTWYTDKPLRYLVENNERMVLYLNKDLWGTEQSDYRASPLTQFESQANLYGFYNCQNHHQIAEYLLNIDNINMRQIPALVNWWLSTGKPCLSEKADLCMTDVEHVETVWDEVMEGTHLHRPVNIVLADYVRPELVQVVKKLNNKAVQFYKTKPW